jgi:hypothetical protein
MRIDSLLEAKGYFSSPYFYGQIRHAHIYLTPYNFSLKMCFIILLGLLRGFAIYRNLIFTVLVTVKLFFEDIIYYFI